MIVILCRNAFLLIVLNAFEASTSKTASDDWSSYISCIACTSDSHPASCPAQTCNEPSADIISSRNTSWTLAQFRNTGGTTERWRNKRTSQKSGTREHQHSKGTTRSCSANTEWQHIGQIKLQNLKQECYFSKKDFCWHVTRSGDSFYEINLCDVMKSRLFTLSVKIFRS